MGEINLTLWMPIPAPVFAVFGGILVLYMLYNVIKFVVSLWTGA